MLEFEYIVLENSRARTNFIIKGFDDAVNITSELHDPRTLVRIPAQQREKT